MLTKIKTVNVIVDNDSWIIPYAVQFTKWLNENQFQGYFCSSHEEIKYADVSFYLGCIKITPQEILKRSRFNLVIHESALPKGKGFSPVSWQILEGQCIIPICLIHAVDEVDAGNIIFQEEMIFEGHELIDEIRSIQGEKTINLCQKFVMETDEKIMYGQPQVGQESFYTRRRPIDSKLDIMKPLVDYFPLFRIVDNEKYPAFFELNGHKYILKITKFQG